MPLPPAMVFPSSFDEGDTLIFTGAAVLRGWSIYETTGDGPAAALIFDGSASSPVLVSRVDLLASESTREWFSGNGILLRTGLFVANAAGAIAGSFYLSPISHADDVSWAFGESGPYFVHGGV